MPMLHKTWCWLCGEPILDPQDWVITSPSKGTLEDAHVSCVLAYNESMKPTVGHAVIDAEWAVEVEDA